MSPANRLRFLLFVAAVLGAPPILIPAWATVATGLGSFEGIEEPTVLYHPSNGTFTNDSYLNITD